MSQCLEPGWRRFSNQHLIKTLDFSAAARNYLHKSLVRIKAVAESPDLPAAVSKPANQSPDTATVNVVARLCNSNPVKEALPQILRDIQQALGIEVSKEVAKGKRTRGKDLVKQTESQKNSDQREDVGDSSEFGSEVEVTMSRRPLPDDDDVMSDEDGQEGSDDDFAHFDSRLADSDTEGESEDSENDADVVSKNSKVSRAQALRAAIVQISASPSPSPSPSPSLSPEPERASQTRASVKPTTSAFVPSLTMGGYWSGSESEPEMDIDVAPKKNRRGQRARQAIAEKKFGTGAKHLQNQQAQGKQGRDTGWDAKRGATDGHRLRGRGGAPLRSGINSSQDRATGGGGAKDATKKKHRDDEGPIHPSWAAAKKAKEAKATAPFQGKKTTFD